MQLRLLARRFRRPYLNFLRAALWENLLTAEKIAEEALSEGPFIRVDKEDRLYSGTEEIAVTTDRFSLLFSPALGGSLWELSWRPAAVNFLDTLTRRPEAYHKDYLEEAASPQMEGGEAESIHNRRSVKEEGILEHLIYDPTPRGALIEHFLDPNATLEEFKKGQHRELGEDFLLKEAQVNLERLDAAGEKAPGLKITFSRTGTLADSAALLLEKTITLFAGADSLQVDYRLTNRSHSEAALSFAVELSSWAATTRGAITASRGATSPRRTSLPPAPKKRWGSWPLWTGGAGWS